VGQDAESYGPEYGVDAPWLEAVVMALPMHVVEAIEQFDAARYRAFRRGVWSALTGGTRDMPALGHHRIVRQAYRGVQEISLARVVGSADSGRAADLDAGFLPTTTRLRPRWIQQYVLLLEGPELPPIEVRKLGERYFVVDGHHRVSVYRSAGRSTIQARVTEVWARGQVDGRSRGRRTGTRPAPTATLAMGRLRGALALPMLIANFAVSNGTPFDRAREAQPCWSCGQRSHHKLWCPNR
jgi:ParB-like nuclease domain